MIVKFYSKKPTASKPSTIYQTVMKKTLFVLLPLIQVTTLFAQSQPPAIAPQPVTEEYFGTQVTDPYRNLENLDDPQVQTWMKAHADYARKTLDAIPGRQMLLNRMKELDDRQGFLVRGLQITENDQYFYFKSRPQDQQPKLYYRNGYEGQEVLLFDPEAYEEGKAYAVRSFTPSIDGSKVALSVTEKGAEVGHMRIINVKTRSLYPDRLERSRGADSWLEDHKRFTYTPFNTADTKKMESRRNQQAFIHTLGTPQSQDKPVFSAELYPELGIGPEQTPYLQYDKDTKLLYGLVTTVDNKLHIYYAPATQLTKPRLGWKPLFEPGQGAVYFGEWDSFVTDGTYFYFSSVKEKNQQRIMRMPVNAPDVEKAEVLVPAGDGTVDELTVTKDGLYFVRTSNGVKAALYFIAKGSKTIEPIPLPKAAGKLALNAKDINSSDLWVVLLGWTQDLTAYRYDAATRQFGPDKIYTENPAAFPEYEDMVVEELMIPSHDGVLVPLSLVYKKGTPRDGSAPVFMEGYGAYGMTMYPLFWLPTLLWAEQGGIYASPHVRGGGELGEAWHLAGKKTTKPNTWKDLIACAEYLVKDKYTSPRKIAINGASAGGILIGRAMTERPDLFAAAIPEVGVLNALRSENEPTGPSNVPEFGTVKDSVECKALIEMDSYLHLKEGTEYPATLVTAGFNDPRVIAWQPAKFAARLQADNTSDKPILFFTDYEAGHGHGNSKQKQFEKFADVLAFGLWQTGHPGFRPKEVEKK
jgi:prolyl oligopeptidase